VRICEHSFGPQIEVLDALYKTMEHFFPSFSTWVDSIDEPRDEAKIHYPLPLLLWLAILLFLTKLGARRQITHVLGLCAETQLSHLSLLTKEDLSHITTIAGDDAVDDLLRQVDPGQVQHIIHRMIRRLIRMRALDNARLLGRYYTITLDGTGLFCRRKRHCDYCLTKKGPDGELLYYHYVLEAKLVTPYGLALPLASEHIENRDGDTFDLSTEKGKQDCELKAFHRIVPAIKAAFPELQCCLLMDSLYANDSAISTVKRNAWSFIISYKEGSIPSVYQEFLSLLPLQPQNRCRWQDTQVSQEIEWATNIAYQTHQLHCIRCRHTETTPNALPQKTFMFLTDIRPTPSTAVALVNKGGRCRWNTEEAFNMQKNGGYELEHVYSTDPNAAKCFHLCLQIADFINQLIEKGSLVRSLIKKAGGLRNTTALLLDALRHLIYDQTDIKRLMAHPCQIRFSSA
jgi:hypothetical protein